MRNLNTNDLKSLRYNVAEAVATLKDSNASDSRKRTAAKLVLANQGLVSPQAIKLANFFQAYEANPYTSSSTDNQVPAKNSWLDAYKVKFKYWLGIKEIVGFAVLLFPIYVVIRILFSVNLIARLILLIEGLILYGRSNEEVANMINNMIKYLSGTWDFESVDLLEPFNKVMPGTLKEIDPITQVYSREVDADNFKKAEIKHEIDELSDSIKKIEDLEAKVKDPEYVSLRPFYMDPEFIAKMKANKQEYLDRLYKVKDYWKSLGIPQPDSISDFGNIFTWIGLPIN